MRRILTIITLIFCIANALPAIGQAPSWEVHFLEIPTGRVLSIGPDGMTTRAELPEIADFSVISDAAITPDGVNLVFGGFRTEEAGIYIASLQEGTCCTKLPDIIPTGADFVELGDFSPDGTRVAAVHSRVNFNAEGDSLAGFVVTYDLATQALGSFIPTSAFPGDTEPLLGAYLGRWYAHGIEVVATCMACDRPTQGSFAIWNPEADSITPDNSIYLGDGHTLRSTGETVRAARDPIYPTGQGLLGNVVSYYPTTAAGQIPFVIYYHAEYPMISSVNWIHNGESLLIAHAGTDVATILRRDGGRAEYTIPLQNQFVATTPNGWLARNESELISYTVQDGELSEDILGGVQGTLVQVASTPMIPQDPTLFLQQLP